MKTLLPLLMLCVTSLAYAQKKDSSATRFNHELISGYGVNNLGKSGHLLYGFGFNNNLFYAGMRFQKNAFYNLSDPISYEEYRHDEDGKMIGAIVGYQRNFNLNNSCITPFAAFDIEYAYLNSRERVMQMTLTGEMKGYEIWKNPARSLWLPSINIGFQTQLYKGLYIKQMFGGTALFDDKLVIDPSFIGPSNTFNGIGFNARLSLMYRF